MENLRNYAIIAIAICTIAMCSTENAPAENKDYICRPADSLNTEHFIKQMSASNAKELSLSKLAKKKIPKLESQGIRHPGYGCMHPC